MSARRDMVRDANVVGRMDMVRGAVVSGRLDMVRDVVVSVPPATHAVAGGLA